MTPDEEHERAKALLEAADALLLASTQIESVVRGIETLLFQVREVKSNLSSAKSAATRARSTLAPIVEPVERAAIQRRRAEQEARSIEEGRRTVRQFDELGTPPEP